MYDIAIIGGGINGCGIARDAAGRGFKVFLAEQNDLASGTSSWSTKLIHGGLRYLEHYEFRLVREALMEREVLWAMAPHIIRPMRFVLPHHNGLRPSWLLRLGLFLYDHIGGRKALPPTRTLDMTSDPVANALKSSYKKAFEFSDCWVDDARLVVLNARDAADRGAVIKTRTRVIEAKRVNASGPNGYWEITTQNFETGEKTTLQARALVNAAGPWVDVVLANTLGQNKPQNVRLVQGSHIVVKKLFDHDRSYFFQNNDGRIFFAIPYEHNFTLIGTTDQDYTGDPGNVQITTPEIDYLCEAANEYFQSPITPDDIVWQYSGVRPLFDDGASKAQEATRDYVLETDGDNNQPLLVNIFGGKITTYRKLSNSVLEKLESKIGKRGPVWSGTEPLPGGNFPITGYNDLVFELAKQHSTLGLEQSFFARLVRLYGTYAKDILAGCKTQEDLGQHFGSGLYEREVIHLIRKEWAISAEDILWRRTKLGLLLTKEQSNLLDQWLLSQREKVDNSAA